MVRVSQRGASLMTVLLLVTIILLVAATMAGVFTLNMNITQRVSNGSIALAEAEAGISEVLYLISAEDAETPSHPDSSSPAEDPKIDFGLNKETLRSTITPEMSEDEAFHIVTFDSSSAFPHSTNNTTLSNNSGAFGRTVPDGMIHLVSTGYCKGQYRTIECVVEKPPFPFGLASSGPIHSDTPLTVKGVSSLANLQAGDIDRPGHILCNSPAGVKIDQVNPPRPTEISGFVKSVGPAVIAQPAVVRGGLRTGADVSTLADINIQNFRNEGEPGVVTLLDAQYDEPQEMDIMYFYSGDTLTYAEDVDLDQALLYVEGNLVIKGAVTGEGLIIVDGDVTFESGTSLSGSNKMAILASGDITIRGNNNYFSGLVYCEGNFSASDVTIVGNTIINSKDSTKGKASLNNVTVISNEETADMTITVTSSDSVETQSGESRFPFPLQFNAETGIFGVPPDVEDGGSLEGWPDLDKGSGYIVGLLTLGENSLWGVATKEGEPIEISFNGGYPPPGSEHLVTGMEDLSEKAKVAQGISQDLQEALDDREALGQDEDTERQLLDQRIASLEADLAREKATFDDDAKALADAVIEFAKRRPDKDGHYDHPSIDLNLEQEHRFNLNEYLPESERIKVSFWKVYPRRM